MSVNLFFYARKTALCPNRVHTVSRLAAVRQAEIIKTRQLELERAYREKKERWLAEIVGLRQKNQRLGETVAELKLALKRKKKSHYRNIAEAAKAAETAALDREE